MPRASSISFHVDGRTSFIKSLRRTGRETLDVREILTEQADFVHRSWRPHPWRRNTRGGTHSIPCRLAPARMRKLYEWAQKHVNCGDYVFFVVNSNDCLPAQTESDPR